MNEIYLAMQFIAQTGAEATAIPGIGMGMSGVSLVGLVGGLWKAFSTISKMEQEIAILKHDGESKDKDVEKLNDKMDAMFKKFDDLRDAVINHLAKHGEM